MDQDLVYKEQPLEFGNSDIEPQELGGFEISPRTQHVCIPSLGPLCLCLLLYGGVR